MQIVSTDEKKFLLEPIVMNKRFGKSEKENQGTPVFHFRNQIIEMSLMGSNLMVERYDEVDY